MRKFLLVAAAFFAFTACDDYDDSALWGEVNNQGNKIDVLESELEALKLKVEGLNQTYRAITSMLNGGVITGVTAVTEGDRSGYIITVQTIVDPTASPVQTVTNTYTIWNGTNGKDGADGDDGIPGAAGSTPQISVELEASTGLYYWVIDGKPLTDPSGNKIYASAQNGADGKPGTPGTPGVAGKDGNTPQLKIDRKSADDPTLVWWVSYDNGTNWIELGVFDGTVEGSSISVSVVDGKVVIAQPGQEPIQFPIVEANNIKITFPSVDPSKGMHLALELGYSVPYTLEGASESAIVKAELLNGTQFSITHEPEQNRFWVNASARPASDVVIVHVYDGAQCMHTSFNVYSDIATITLVEREVTLPLLYGDAADFEYTGRIALDMPAAEDIELTFAAGDATLPAENFSVANVRIAKGATSAAYKVVIKRNLTAGTSYTLPLTVASASDMGRIREDQKSVSIAVVDTPSKMNYTADDVTCNATATYDGIGLPGLCDGDVSTYWHSPWSGENPTDPTYGVMFDWNLAQPIVAVYFNYWARATNDAVVPKAIAIGLSEDGSNWTLAGAEEGLSGAGASARTQTYSLAGGAAISAIRFGITASTNGSLLESSNGDHSTALGELEVYVLY